MLDKIVDRNKKAASGAGRLVTGKTATDLVMSRLVSRLPWMSRIFKGNSVKNNELARLGVAEAALALQIQFAPDNKNLATVAEAMVEHTMAEAVVNSKLYTNLAEELEKLVP